MGKITEISKKGITISQRKSEHLRIVAEEDVNHSGSSLLDNIHLLHQALPELDLGEIDTSTTFFGKELRAPLIISSMTGGAEMAKEMNRGLASAASRYGIAFAVGSQRVMLRHPEVISDFAVREWIPDGVLLGNIGAVQLDEYTPKVIAQLVDDIDADGICVHLNVAQELLQEEGHRHFRGMLDGIARLVDKLDGKVMVKETGAGLSPRALEKLAEMGVPCIDVAGSGGTSWTKVETHRISNRILKRVGDTFSDWGIPTAFSIIAAKRIFEKKSCVVASGGIFSGLDAARAIAAGADIAGFARPVLLPFLEEGENGAWAFIENIIEELRTAMLLTGSINIQTLQETRRVYTGELREWLLAHGWIGAEGN